MRCGTATYFAFCSHFFRTVVMSSNEEKSRPEPQDLPDITVVRSTAVGVWSWGGGVQTCAICRNNIMERCIECEANSVQGDDCSIAWGECNHMFHFHCVSRFMKTRGRCPLCDADWEYKEIRKVD